MLDYRVLLVRTPAPSVDVDVVLAGLPFEAEMIDRAVTIEFQPGNRYRSPARIVTRLTKVAY